MKHAYLAAALLFVSLPVFCAVKPTQIDDPSQAIYMLYDQDTNGSMTFQCSVSQIGPRELLTAGHCVTTLNEQDHSRKLVQKTFYVSDGSPSPAYVRVKIVLVGNIGEGYDFAVLSTQQDLKTKPLALGDERDEEDLTPIVVVGSPLGLGKVPTFGRVALKAIDRPIVTDNVNWIGNMLVDVKIDFGSSGSPVISMNTGKIIGVIVGFYNPGAAEWIIALPVSRYLNPGGHIFFEGKK